MHDPVLVQVGDPVQQLPQQRLERVGLQRHHPLRLVPVEADHLVQVVLRVVERQRQARLLQTRRPPRDLPD